MKPFIRNALHWAIGLAAVLAVGPLAARLLSTIVDARGDHLVSLVSSVSPVKALLGVLVLFAGMLFVGRVGRLIGGVSLALLCAGLVAGWGAYGFGTVEEALRATHTGSFFPLLAVEGLLLTLLAALLTAHLAAPAMHDAHEASDAAKGTEKRKLPLLSSLVRMRASSGLGVMLQCVVVAGIVGAAVAALCSTSTLRGQTLFAAFAGAVAAGVAAQVTAAAGSARISPAVPVLGMALAALAGPIITILMHGANLVPQTFSGNLTWIGRVLPIDWAAGAILGAHVGMGWAGATLAQAGEHAGLQSQHAQDSAAATTAAPTN